MGVGGCALHLEPTCCTHFTKLLTTPHFLAHFLAYYLRNFHFVHLYTNCFVKCCGFMCTSRQALLRQTCLLQCGLRMYVCAYHSGLKRWCDSWPCHILTLSFPPVPSSISHPLSSFLISSSPVPYSFPLTLPYPPLLSPLLSFLPSTPLNIPSTSPHPPLILSPYPLSPLVSSLSYGRDDPAMKTIHRDMKAFLQEEQEAMEARVKDYEEEQRRRFSELQSRAHRDRTAIFR